MLTKKHRLKKVIMNMFYIGNQSFLLVINLLQRLHGQSSEFHNLIFALEIFCEEKSLISKYFLTQLASTKRYASTLKCTDRIFLKSNIRILWILSGFSRRVKMLVINSGDTHVNTYSFYHEVTDACFIERELMKRFLRFVKSWFMVACKKD